MRADQMTIGVITQLTETGVKQSIDFMGEVTTRIANVSAKQMDAGIREKLIELGWTPPGEPCVRCRASKADSDAR